MKRYLLLSMVLASLYGCAAIAPGSQSGLLAQVDDITTGAPQTLAAVAEVNGKPALLYSTQNNRIAFQYGDQRRLLDETARVHGGNRFQLHLMDQKLLAMWWSHQDGKNLYSALSDNQGKEFAPVTEVNDRNGVLPPPSVLYGPGGVLGVTYLDERQLGYQFYFNRSVDSGRTWAHPDQRLDIQPTEGASSRVQEPQAVQAGSVWFAVWADTERVSGSVGYRILGRRSEDAGQNWSAPEVIYRPQKFVSSLTVRAQGERIVIAADERGRGVVAIASKDQGRSWSVSAFLEGTDFPPNDDGASNSGIELALSGDRAHLVWMQDKGGNKTRVMHGSLDIAQVKWISAAQRLDTKGFDNTRSIMPVVFATSQGVVWAAWADYRDIRPNIYVSTSSDQGQSWTAPEAFLQPGEVSAGLPRLLPWAGGIAMAYEIYPTERELSGKFVLRTMALGENGKLIRAYSGPTEVNEAERTTRLQQRLKTLWDYRLAGNYELAYDIFDFAYKAATPKKHYVDNVGVISYQSYSIEDIAITGNVAAVKMKMKYEVPPTTLPSGKPIKLPSIDVDATNTWVWVGNDWYLVYAPSFGQPNLRY